MAPRRKSKGTRSPKDKQVASTRGKRKLAQNFEAITSPKVAKRPSKEFHDNYCWKCHQLCNEEKCSTCHKVYHTKCLTKSTQFDADGVCHQCREFIICNHQVGHLIDNMELLEVLPMVVRNSFSSSAENDSLSVWQAQVENYKLHPNHIVDYRLICDKAKVADREKYKSPIELLEDVKWLYHNCVIIYGTKSYITRNAKKTLDQCKLEIEDLFDCPLCYHRKNTEEPFIFEKPCPNLHPIIWAKIKFFPPWPAKCFRVTKGKAHVRFFYTNQIGRVPIQDCLFISKRFPGNEPKNSEQFLLSMEHMRGYFDLFKKIYDEDYPFQPQGTKFNYESAMEILETFKENYQSRQQSFATDEQESLPTGPNKIEPPDFSNPPPTRHVNSEIRANQSRTVHGRLLPGIKPFNENEEISQLPVISEVTTDISISNVVSANDMPPDTENPVDQLMDTTFSSQGDGGQTVAIYSSKNAASYNFQNVTVPDANMENPPVIPCPDEEEADSDIEIIEPEDNTYERRKIWNQELRQMQRTLKQDPQVAQSCLQYAHLIFAPLFNRLYMCYKNAANSNEVCAAKEEVKQLQNKYEELQKNAEKYEVKLKNADLVVKDAMVSKETVQKEADKLQVKIQRLESEMEKLTNKNKTLEADRNNIQESYNATLDNVKKQDWCSQCGSSNPKYLCCWDYSNIYKFCSLDCKDRSNHRCSEKSVNLMSKMPQAIQPTMTEEEHTTIQVVSYKIRSDQSTSTSTVLDKQWHQVFKRKDTNESGIPTPFNPDDAGASRNSLLRK